VDASTGPIFHAGSRNFFDPANVWTDERDALHLRISGSPESDCGGAEAHAQPGYGTYRFQVRDVSHLEPSALLTLITWDGVGTEATARVDVELGRWGFLDNTNANYVVQPYYVSANLLPFGPAWSLHTFVVGTGKVTFFDGSRIGNTTAVASLTSACLLRCAFPEGESGAHRLDVFPSRAYPPKKRK